MKTRDERFEVIDAETLRALADRLSGARETLSAQEEAWEQARTQRIIEACRAEGRPATWEDFKSSEANPASELSHTFYRQTGPHAAWFAIHAAAHARDVTLLPTVDRLLEAWAGHLHDQGLFDHELKEALARLVAATEAPAEWPARWATSRVHELRGGAAAAARPDVEEERAVILELLRDPDGYVRYQARRRLTRGNEVPWWYGPWRSDPLAGLTAPMRTRLAPSLEQLAAAMDGPLTRERNAKIDALLAELDLEPLREPIGLLARDKLWLQQHFEIAAAALVAAPGTRALCADLLDGWRLCYGYPPKLVKGLLAEAPADAAERIRAAMAEVVEERLATMEDDSLTKRDLESLQKIVGVEA